MDGEHKDEGAEDCDDSREKLCEAQEKSVGKLVGVIDDAAEHIARGVTVEIGQGEALDLQKCLAAQVMNHVECYIIIDDIHYPLEYSGGGGADSDEHQLFGKKCVALGDRHLARSDDKVDGISREYRDIEGKSHDECGEDYRENQAGSIASDMGEDGLYRL